MEKELTDIIELYRDFVIPIREVSGKQFPDTTR